MGGGDRLPDPASQVNLDEPAAEQPIILVQPARPELALRDPQVARAFGVVAAHLVDGAAEETEAHSRPDSPWLLLERHGDAHVGPDLYVDTSDVREGALEELKAGMKELTDFVEANEPRIIAYNVYFNDEGTRMTVVHAHVDSASFEHRMEVAGPLFAG